MMYTTNASMVDAVIEENKSSPAGLRRMFEVQVQPKPGVMKNADIGDLQVELRNNYGWAGLKYAEWLGANEDMVREETKTMMRTLEKALNSDQDRRYHVAAVATMLRGAKYANKLGLTKINLPALHRFLLNEFRRMTNDPRILAGEIERLDNIVAYVNDYLREKRAKNTLITDRVWHGRGRPSLKAVTIINEGQSLDMRMGEVEVQLAKMQNLLLIAERPFTEWLRRRNVQTGPFKDSMIKKLGATRLSMTVLAAGTRFSSGFKEELFQIDLNGSALADYVQWDDTATHTSVA